MPRWPRGGAGAGPGMEAGMNLPRGPENLCFDKDEFMKVQGCGGASGRLRVGVTGSLRERGARSLGRGFTAPPRPCPRPGAAGGAEGVTDRGSGGRPCPRCAPSLTGPKGLSACRAWSSCQYCISTFGCCLVVCLLFKVSCILESWSLGTQPHDALCF